MPDFYGDLGVDKSATPEEIKKAFKKQASKHHPDKGGDTGKFQAIALAYEVLGDERRRATYDATGEDQTKLDRQRKLREELAGAFMAAADRAEAPEHEDLLTTVRRYVTNAVTQNLTKVGQLQAKALKLQRVAKRLHHSGKGDDFIGSTLQGEITATKQAVLFVEDQIDLQNEMLSVLEQYSYKTDKPPEVRINRMMTFRSTGG